MCVENMVLGDIIKDEEKEKIIMKACTAVLTYEEMLKNVKANIDEEKKERKEDTSDIRNNYIDRFNKVDKRFDKVDENIDDTRKAIDNLDEKLDKKIDSIKTDQIAGYKKAIYIFIGCTGIVFITQIWEKAVNFIISLF